MLFEIFDAEFPYKLSYFEPLCLLNKMAVKTVKSSIQLLGYNQYEWKLLFPWSDLF